MNSERAFSLSIERNGHGAIVRLAGELDLATAPQLRECLQSLEGRSVTLDFAAVTFMDSTAIGACWLPQGKNSKKTATRWCSKTFKPHR
jgi:anti-anti-sigma factor